MAEEQMLSKQAFPGGTFRAVVSWFSGISNSAQEVFVTKLYQHKQKTPNIFLLLGWEAGLVCAKLLYNSHTSLKGWSYESPRGLVTFHPETHHTYAPLYDVSIVPDNKGMCTLAYNETVNITARAHLLHLQDRPEGIVSNWKNNYFCI